METWALGTGSAPLRAVLAFSSLVKEEGRLTRKRIQSCSQALAVSVGASSFPAELTACLKEEKQTAHLGPSRASELPSISFSLVLG